MKNRAWKEVHERIRSVLMQAWDPIGVKAIPEAADEYDGYIAGIYALLRDGASDEQIARHLSDIETKEMGLSSAPSRYASVIAQLRSLQLPAL